MKKLTGRAAEDFADQSELDYHEFIKLPETCQNALIIEWFDSVGIYIITVANFDWGFELYQDGESKPIRIDCDMKNRTEATNAGIIKANELYNLNN